MSLFDDLAAVLRRPDSRPIAQIEDEILDELDFHLEMRTQENLRAGIPAPEARANALHRFGDYNRIYRDCRRALLGERIVLQRLQTLLTAVLLVAVVGLGVQFYRWHQDQEATMTRMIEVLDHIAASSPADGREALAAAIADLQPPKVVKTEPETGATGVDPAIAEIVVTFNKPMTDESWSWVQTSDDTFPESAGDVHYRQDRKTCVMPVKLRPRKTYEIWLNDENFQNFRDDAGRPAVPYCFRFQTRP